MRALLLTASLLAAAFPAAAANRTAAAPKAAATTAAAAPRSTELNRIVAVVNDDVITAKELDDRMVMVSRQLRQSKTAAPDPKALRKQVLDRVVLERLQLEQAKNRGIRVDDETVNQVMSAIAKENNLTFDQFRGVLEHDGIDFARFRESVRNEVIIGRLRNAQVDSKVTVTPQEVDLLLESTPAAQNSEYHLYHILIAVPEAASPTDVQASRAKAEKVVGELRHGADFREMAVTYSNDERGLQGGDLGWRQAGQLPAVFAELVQKMAPGEISDPVRSPAGFHIIKLAEKRDQAHSTLVQTHARHILIKTSEMVSEEEAKNRIDRIYDRLTQGADFEELARTNSEDPGSAAKGGDLGWTNPGDFVPAFQQEVDKLEPNQISRPFKSRFGWHVVQLLGRRTQDDSKQQLRAKAQELLRQRKIEEETQDWLRRLRDEAYVEYRLES